MSIQTGTGVQSNDFAGVERINDRDVRAHNRDAWDRNVEKQNRWTVPVSHEVIEETRQGRVELLLTPTKAVPINRLFPLESRRVLCLAGAGGQQGPILAAAGACVTVFDNSPRQLPQDRLVAEREGLNMETVEGDMADLSAFCDDSFDLIVHPCSICFVADVRSVWREAFRVLRPGKALLAGFVNPLRYLFDSEKLEQGNLTVRFSLPYSDLIHLSDDERNRIIVKNQSPLEFGHTLTDQIGEQLDAGFHLVGFYEDGYPDTANDPITRHTASFIATRAVKP